MVTCHCREHYPGVGCNWRGDLSLDHSRLLWVAISLWSLLFSNTMKQNTQEAGRDEGKVAGTDAGCCISLVILLPVGQAEKGFPKLQTLSSGVAIPHQWVQTHYLPRRTLRFRKVGDFPQIPQISAHWGLALSSHVTHLILSRSVFQTYSRSLSNLGPRCFVFLNDGF